MVTTVRVGTASTALVGEFVALSRTYYGDSDSAATDPVVVAWRHLESDTSPSTTVELVDAGECVGRMWIQIRPWSVRGARIRAANPIDFLIREDHRRLPAFMSLFKATMSTAQGESDVVYHSSNPLTDDLYRKLMKFKPVTEMDGAVFPIRPGAAAAAAGVVNLRVFGHVLDLITSLMVRAMGVLARIGGVRLTDAPTAAEQDAIVDSFVLEEEICCARTAAHRAWRYKGAKDVAYRTNWIQIRGKNRGYIVISDRDVDSVRGSFVIDMVLPGKFSLPARWSLWLQVAASSARRDRHAVFFFYNRKNPRLRARAGIPLITVGRKRLPQQIPVFVRPHSDAELHTVDWATGYYVLSDFDMF